MTKQERLLSFSYLSLIGLWFCGYLVLLAKIAFAQKLFFYSQGKDLHYSDYVLWYVAGQVALSDQKQHLYNPAVLVDYWNRLSAPALMPTAPVFQYPPFFALLFSPFALLPLELSYLLWTVSSLAAGLASLYAAVKKTDLMSKAHIPIFLLASSASYPSWISLRSGQLVWFYLSVFSFYHICLRARRDITAGIMLSLLSTKPQYLIFMIIPALAGKRWKILASFAVGEIFLLLAAAVTFGPANVIGYPSILLQQETSSKLVGVHPGEMVSMRLLFSLLLPQALALPASILFMFSAVIILGIFWFQILRRREDLINWAMAITVATAVVASAHSHVYDTLLLALSAALTLRTCNLFEASRFEQKSLRIWHIAFILYPLLGCLLFLQHEWFPLPLAQSLTMISINFLIFASGLLYLKQAMAGDFSSTSKE